MEILRGVMKETRKVKWLTRKDIWSRFLSTALIVAVILLYFGAIDLVVNLIKSI